MVKPEEDGWLLLDMLVARAGGSRRAAKRRLDERRVFINGRRVWMARHTVRAGDRIELPDALPDSAPGRRALRPGQAPASRNSTGLRILYEDADYLVADKPAGLVTNESADSLESNLRRERNDAGWRAVHRLDRDTTGCTWFAHSAAAFDAAVEVFRAQRVKKIYDAIVLGRFPPGLRRMCEPLDGQPAETWVEIVKARDTASHLRLRITTGRTHQIRRHLLAADHPLVGDKHYGASRELGPDLRALPRQMLHATDLSAPHPLRSDTRVHARAPLPDDFRSALRRLRLS